MINLNKIYYTKLGYKILFIGRGDNYVNGRIQGDNQFHYRWNIDSSKVRLKYESGLGWQNFEDEDYDLVENFESFKGEVAVGMSQPKNRL